MSWVLDNVGYPSSDEGVETMATLKRDVFSQAMLMLYDDSHANWGHADWLVKNDYDYTVIGVTDSTISSRPNVARKLHVIFTKGTEMAKLQDSNVHTAPASATDTQATALA
ncbi:hypothetical protein, partial [Streptococcus suis]|uniref:hypothetical protein n=1 Tax=Streptococcus suis TaxID=1307 RepID=UPI00128FF29D